MRFAHCLSTVYVIRKYTGIFGGGIFHGKHFLLGGRSLGGLSSGNFRMREFGRIPKRNTFFCDIFVLPIQFYM